MATGPSTTPPPPVSQPLANNWEARISDRVNAGLDLTNSDGAALNVHFSPDEVRAALGPAGNVLASHRSEGSTEVRLNGGASRAEVRGESWGLDISGSKITNADFYGTNMRGQTAYMAEFRSVTTDKNCLLDSANYIKCKFFDCVLEGQGRVRSLRDSQVSVGSKINLDVRGSDLSGLRFSCMVNGVLQEGLTAQQLFDHIASTDPRGKDAALETFKEMFRGTIYNRNTKMDSDLRNILDQVSAATKKALTNPLNDRAALFNELDASPQFANDFQGTDGSLSRRERAADNSSYVLKLHDVDSPRAAVITVTPGRNATDTADVFKISYVLEGGLTERHLVDRHGLPASGTIGLTGTDAFRAMHTIVRDIERQFRGDSTAMAVGEAPTVPAAPAAASPSTGPAPSTSGTSAAPSSPAAAPGGSAPGAAPSGTPSATPGTTPVGTDPAAAPAVPEDPSAAAPSGSAVEPTVSSGASEAPSAAPAIAEAAEVEVVPVVTAAPGAAQEMRGAVVNGINSAMAEFNARNPGEGSELPARVKRLAERSFGSLIDEETGEFNRGQAARIRESLAKEGDEDPLKLTPAQKELFGKFLNAAERNFGPQTDPSVDAERWGEQTKGGIDALRTAGLDNETADRLNAVVDNVVEMGPDGRVQKIDDTIGWLNEQKPEAGSEITPAAAYLLGRRLLELREAEVAREASRIVGDAEEDVTPASAPAEEADRTTENTEALNQFLGSLRTGYGGVELYRRVEGAVDLKTGNVDARRVNEAVEASLRAIDEREETDKEFARTSDDLTYDSSIYANERMEADKVRRALVGTPTEPNIFGVQVLQA